ncbi:DUF4194 domain-containing protein [Methylomonas sp. MgM2]
MDNHITTEQESNLPALAVTLLKSVVYRESNARLWSDLMQLQARVRDYMAVIGLELVLDEAEGYAFLRSKTEAGDEAETLPRLIARRPLSFSVSLLLALLRKKLAEFDAAGGDTLLVLTRDEIVELIRVFLPDSSNEARLIDQIETQINKVAELGFLRKLKAGSANSYEVRRILKAYVDAQWLADFDAKLEAYRAELSGGGEEKQ